MGQVQLRLFGTVAWDADDHDVPIVGGRRLGVLLLLAERQGATVSVDEILDRLWSTPPSSGANAVQRHISALRKDLQQFDHVEAGAIVESAPGGYRLSAEVLTDLNIIEDCLTHGLSADSIPVKWWEAPLLGAADGPHQLFRHRLEAAAAELFGHWVSAEQPSAGVVARRRAQLGPHAPPITDVRLLPASTDDTTDRRKSATALRRAFGLWADGRADDALDLVDDHRGDLDVDLRTRLIRWLVWLSPADPHALSAARQLPQALAATPVQAERTIAALDGYALLFDVDAERTIAYERSRAATTLGEIRCLRAEYLYRLAQPADATHDERIADRLAAIDAADGRVEAARFRFINALRRGRLGEAVRLLESYERAVDSHWPWQGDDFAELARAILRRSVDGPARSLFGPAQPRIDTHSCDQVALRIADIICRLLCPDRGRHVSDHEVGAIDCFSPPESAAFDLLLDLAHRRSIAESAYAMADSLPHVTRDKTFAINLIALTLAAERLAEPDLADRVSAAMAPWTGQGLGCWPSSYYFGPADQWLDRLAAVRSSIRAVNSALA